jgi:hypothetical protein
MFAGIKDNSGKFTVFHVGFRLLILETVAMNHNVTIRWTLAVIYGRFTAFRIFLSFLLHIIYFPDTDVFRQPSGRTGPRIHNKIAVYNALILTYLVANGRVL